MQVKYVSKKEAIKISGVTKTQFENLILAGVISEYYLDENKIGYDKDQIRRIKLIVKEVSINDNKVDKSKVNLNDDFSEDNSQLDYFNQENRRKADPRNKLNDLNGTEWLPETKSYMYQKGLGSKHPHAQIEKMHPAPYSYQDIMRLIRFFTKIGDHVLDPFGGVGSTAKACQLLDRRCTSVELSERWHDLSLRRLKEETRDFNLENHNFILGDSTEILKEFPDKYFDFVVTSPPYWSILNKKADHKVIKNRLENNLATNYSQNGNDLGNIENYEEFLKILVDKIIFECGRVLKNDKYLCLVVSDFRNKSEFISFHSDLIQKITKTNSMDFKLSLQGTKILLQNHKSLLPYGYPFAYVENIHHQYILIFRKTKKMRDE
ncbi:MAG: hypothetical protein KGZ51_00095 [Erysipelothrix sp.]|jgi:DNA modification methylase|nr:hypothetical protein [Erysipelothrix sp.]